jgi:hypothetical protein
MSSLIHVAYASEASTEFSNEAVRRLLDDARRNNAAIGVTGILLLVDRSFFQVLEGEPGAVSTLYEKIERDPRHTHVVKLIREPIEKRDFPDWSMGLARMAPRELSTLPGFSDFFTTGRSLSSLAPGMAHRLLSGFRAGRWRARSGA